MGTSCRHKAMKRIFFIFSILFFLLLPSAPAFAQGGIVPCAATEDNPTTPWDEREDCTFKHLLLLAKNFIDVLLWQVSVVIIILLTLYTGFVLYFSFGKPDTLARVKSIWKQVGVGLLILLLSWTFINFL